MMKLDTVITGGRVIDPSTGIDECTDIGILEGKISEIGDLSKEKRQVILTQPTHWFCLV